MAVSYADAFKRQLRRLSRRHPRIRDDVQPIIDRLEAGETPGDCIQGLGQVLYKVRVRNTGAVRGKSGGYRIIYYLRTATDVLLVMIDSKSEQSDIAADKPLRTVRDER